MIDKYIPVNDAFIKQQIWKIVLKYSKIVVVLSEPSRFMQSKRAKSGSKIFQTYNYVTSISILYEFTGSKSVNYNNFV